MYDDRSHRHVSIAGDESHAWFMEVFRLLRGASKKSDVISLSRGTYLKVSYESFTTDAHFLSKFLPFTEARFVNVVPFDNNIYILLSSFLIRLIKIYSESVFVSIEITSFYSTTLSWDTRWNWNLDKFSLENFFRLFFINFIFHNFYPDWDSIIYNKFFHQNTQFLFFTNITTKKYPDTKYLLINIFFY